jgi:hypothetical protein
VCGKAMAEGMRGVLFFNMRGMSSSLKADFTHGTHSQVRTFTASPFEEIMLGLVFYEILAHIGKAPRANAQT